MRLNYHSVQKKLLGKDMHSYEEWTNDADAIAAAEFTTTSTSARSCSHHFWFWMAIQYICLFRVLVYAALMRYVNSCFIYLLTYYY